MKCEPARWSYTPLRALPASGLLDKCPAEERGLHRMTGFVVVEGEGRASGISMARLLPVLKS